MKNYLKSPEKYLVKGILLLINVYQRTISPDHGFLKYFFSFSRCRFYPSCSDYAASSFRQYGLFRGIMTSIIRLFKCNPFNKGGYDPV